MTTISTTSTTTLSDNWQRRFGGIARLYGVSAAERLAQAHFVVLGLGGVGSWAAEALARTGVGALTLIDPDEVCLSNVNRQLPALSSSAGEAKAEVLAERLSQINPELRLSLRLEFLTKDNLEQLLPACDGIVDAIDQVGPKTALLNHAKRNKINLIVTGGAGGQRDPRLLATADLSQTYNDPLLAKVRNNLRRHYGFPREGKKFGIECVYSSEQLHYPNSEGELCSTQTASDKTQSNQGTNTPLRLDCASGFGAVSMVTASFGMMAASRLIERFLAKNST